jgi:hypothetical protein
MSDLTGYNQDVPDDSATAAPEPGGEAPEAKQSVLAQVTKIIDTIKGDKAFHSKAFKRMGESMYMAFHGHDRTWGETKYTANFAGRHVRRKTDALYAKNPKATATRNERMDFTVWDENPQSLQMAFQITQQAQLALSQAAQMTAATPPDPITGMQVPVQPQLPQGFDQAQQIIADFQQGTAYRQMVDKVGRTLEILFARALKDQEPLDFKMAAKALVRRACTCGVGYVELGFVREVGPAPDIDTQLADARVRLDHLRTLAQDAVAGDIDDNSAEMAELEGGINALTTQPEIVLREGLVFDFPQATKVIPDKLTRQLVGFVGARHIAIEYLFTCEQIREMFPEATSRNTATRATGRTAPRSTGRTNSAFRSTTRTTTTPAAPTTRARASSASGSTTTS